MIISQRELDCGCTRRNMDERDEALSDSNFHDGHERNALNYITLEKTPLKRIDSLLAARALTWFYRHDDNRGVEILRRLPKEHLIPLVRGMRTMEREEWHDRSAVSAFLQALGLRPLDD